MNLSEIVLGHASSHWTFGSLALFPNQISQCHVDEAMFTSRLLHPFWPLVRSSLSDASIHRFIRESVLRIGFAVVQMPLQTSFAALLTWVLAAVWQCEAKVPATLHRAATAI